ncbi:MAG: metallophosphoesterase [Bacteroidota bacterium]|jgi:predicted MPP superfamily phosphohydrolase
MHTQAIGRFLSRRQLLTGLGAAAMSGLSTGSYAFAIEPAWRLDVVHRTVVPRGWPKGLKLTIAALADIHAGGWIMPVERVHAIAEQTNALQPDLVVLLGDFAASRTYGGQPVPAQEWSQALSVLRAPLGVHAILGNHDWWDDLVAQREGKGPVFGRRMLERAGIPVYENDATRLKKDGHAFWLAGLADQLALINRAGGRRRYRGVDDLAGTLARVKDDAPVILLAHEPDVFPAVPDRVALTLSGHTHGGQVRLLGYSPVVPSRYGNRYAYGHIVEDGRNLIVSGGLGCSVLPVRLGVPPEIVLIHVGA